MGLVISYEGLGLIGVGRGMNGMIRTRKACIGRLSSNGDLP